MATAEKQAAKVTKEAEVSLLDQAIGATKQTEPDRAKAREDFLHAQSLAPNNADIEDLFGHLAKSDGKLDEAAAHFRKAAAGDPGNLRRLYMLIELAKESAAPDEERQRLVEQILERRPTTLHLLALRLQLAAGEIVFDGNNTADLSDDALTLSRMTGRHASRILDMDP